jgi:hypothetical protein
MRLAILYEHPTWFKPLFERLDALGTKYDLLHAAHLSWDPACHSLPYTLIVNRMSPSAHLRGHANAISAARAFLHYVESLGIEVVNGAASFDLETSKAAQLELLGRLSLRYPRARVINAIADAPVAADDLNFPVALKPNIGGSGAGIHLFETPWELRRAAQLGEIDLGIDGTALVQEWLPARGGAVVRVEVLQGAFLYAIRITPPKEGGFNLCPADICRDPEPAAGYCAAEAPKRQMRIEAYTPPPKVIASALRIAEAAHLDVGGIEYLVNARDGQVYFYDINALSNFVTGALELLGFDPHIRFAEYLVERAQLAAPLGAT